MKCDTIGIISAMDVELASILDLIKDKQEEKLGPRTFIKGNINQINVVATISHWGKIAAAEATSLLIHKFGVNKVIFIGLAGSLNDSLHIGDIVIGKDLYQHDMKPEPVFPAFKVPILGTTSVTCAEKDISRVKATIDPLLPKLTSWKHSPRCYIADIATGDSVISSQEQKNEIKAKIPSAFCVDMESAAVAFVAKEYDIPFVVIRAISDDADDTSSLLPFAKQVWSKNSKQIIEELISI